MQRLLLVAGTISIVFAAYVWSRSSAPQVEGGGQERPVAVVTARSTRTDIPIYLDGLGMVQASRIVVVRSRVDGELTEVAAKEGQDVKAGDVLARIDPRTYKAQFDQAVAARDRDAAQVAR